MKRSHAVLLLALAAPAHGQDAPTPRPQEPAVLRPHLVRHYEQVERELLAADVSHLNEAQRVARQRAIEVLRSYRLRGAFGQNETRPAERQFLFVDPDGRRCAVAHLLDTWGHGELTNQVAQRHNGALVVELAGDRAFQGFLEDLGLSLWEAARIQGPVQSPPPPPHNWDGPGDVVPNGPPTPPTPGTPTPPTRPGAPAVTPTPRGTAASPGATSGAPRGMAVTVGAPETWEVWWSWNRLGFLERVTTWGGSTSPITPAAVGDGDATALAAGLRARAQQRILPWLEHPEPRLRTAALFALGELGDAEAVPAMLAALEDAHRRVREEALLALGQMALPRATHALLRIAVQGTLRHGERELVLRDDERALAITALGIAARRGSEAPILAGLEHLAREDGRSREATLGVATLVHASLVPDLVALARARDLAAREDSLLATRVQAIRSLAASRDGESLATLVRTLADPNLDVRIASALALANVQHDLALPSLLTAYEVEREQRTRGMLLLAIAERGSEPARAFLAQELERGARALRPFAALGLGVLARRDADADVSAALVRAHRREKNRGVRSAYVLALGLARVETETLALAKEAFAGGSASERAYAGQALAFLGSERARTLLVEQIAADPCTTTRLSLGESLGYVPGADLTVLGERIEQEGLDAWRHALARALGWNATSSTVAHVLDALERPGLDPKTVATYVEAAGWLLARHPDVRPTIELARHTHPDVFPGWMATAFQRAF